MVAVSTSTSSPFKPTWVSPERFADFLDAANSDTDLAAELYQWNAHVSSTLFEVIHHVEVLVRNAMVEQLQNRKTLDNTLPGTPWVQQAAQVEEVAGRLKKLDKEPSLHRIVAGVTFGFWATMFDTQFESLWRSSLRFAFPHSPGDRKTLVGVMKNINQLRNTIAHHGNLLKFDPVIELEKLAQLAGWVDPDAERWIRSIERVTFAASQRPVPPRRNVMIVAAKHAWPLYEKVSAYICPHDRTFRPIEYIGFYADSEIKPVFAKVIKHLPIVTLSQSEARSLRSSTDPDDRLLSQVIGASLANQWTPGPYQVFLLSSAKDADTKRIASAIAHNGVGRGSAFVQGHRYVSLSAAMSATSTTHLRGS